MFEIHDNDIYISRGEPAVLNITPTEDNGEIYTLDPLERLELRIYDFNRHVSRKMIRTENGTTEFKIKAEDTKGLWGTLAYNVRLVFADGSYKTIIGETPTQLPRFYVLEG